MLFTCNALQLF